MRAGDIGSTDRGPRITRHRAEFRPLSMHSIAYVRGDCISSCQKKTDQQERLVPAKGLPSRIEDAAFLTIRNTCGTPAVVQPVCVLQPGCVLAQAAACERLLPRRTSLAEALAAGSAALRVTCTGVPLNSGSVSSIPGSVAWSITILPSGVRVSAWSSCTFGASATASAPSTDLLEPLTGRELEVLRLLAASLSNREIAAELFLAVGTVKKHTSNIYGKLDVHSRTQATERARDLGLI